MKKIIGFIALFGILSLPLNAVTLRSLSNSPSNLEIPPATIQGSHSQRISNPTAQLTPGDTWFESDTLSTYQWNGVFWDRIKTASALDTFTPTPTPTFTITSTFTPTPTFTNTFSPTCQSSRTPICANQGTFTFTFTPTCQSSRTPACQNQFTNTPTNTPTNTLTPTSTLTPMSSSTPVKGSELVMVGKSLELSTPVITVNGSRIQVSLTSHGLSAGDYVVFGGLGTTGFDPNFYLWPIVNASANYFECQTNFNGTLGLGSPYLEFCFFGGYSKNLNLVKRLTGSIGDYAVEWLNPQPFAVGYLEGGNFSKTLGGAAGPVLLINASTTQTYLATYGLQDLAYDIPSAYFFVRFTNVK